MSHFDWKLRRPALLLQRRGKVKINHLNNLSARSVFLLQEHHLSQGCCLGSGLSKRFSSPLTQHVAGSVSAVSWAMSGEPVPPVRIDCSACGGEAVAGGYTWPVVDGPPRVGLDSGHSGTTSSRHCLRLTPCRAIF